MSNWQDIKVSKPAQDQPVWYYVDVFNEVYAGLLVVKILAMYTKSQRARIILIVFMESMDFCATMLTIGFPVKRGKKSLSLIKLVNNDRT